jgi:hypothetical protein
MKRPFLVLVFCVASIVVPEVAAPAKTIYVPQMMARQVTQAGPGAARLAFPATHVVFSWTGGEGTGVRYRLVGANGVPGEWTRAHEAHDLERGDEHFSGVIAVDRPQDVEWVPLVPEGVAMGSVTLDYMNASDGPLQKREVPATAEAAVETPDIVTRQEWGADESLQESRGCTRSFYPVQQLFVHHTAGSNGDDDPYATMRAIYYFHTASRGWCDVGYNFVIAPDGTIFEGRWARPYAPWETHTSEDDQGRSVAGAHASGYNSGSVGISMMGNFSQVKVPATARAALVQMLAWEADRHSLDPVSYRTYRNPESGSGRNLPVIAGHKDAGQTACPGDNLYRALPKIREEVAIAIGTGKAGSSIGLSTSAKSVDHGDSVSLSGSAVRDDGTPVASQPVQLYLREGSGRWRDLGGITTGADGSFYFTATPNKTARVAVVYGGDVTTWGSQSRKVKIAVRPFVTLAAAGGDSGSDGVIRYAEGTKRIPLAGEVSPALPGRTVRLLVFALDPEGSETRVKDKIVTLDELSSFAKKMWMGAAPRDYRAVAWYQKGGGYLTRRSASVFFTVE